MRIGKIMDWNKCLQKLLGTDWEKYKDVGVHPY